MKFLRAVAWIAGILAVIGLILRLLLFKVWTIPDDPLLDVSMAPTLAVGDVVVVLTRGKPTFGELVRCANDDDPGHYLIGRIAGVAGDKVEVDGAGLFVNGKAYNSTLACTKPTTIVEHPTTGAETELHCDVVDMGGISHLRASAPRTLGASKSRTDVGEGMLYLVSDDRAFPHDSRSFGTVPVESCTERIVFRLVSGEGWSDDEARLTLVR